MANIPVATQQNLDLLGEDTTNWQKDFYERQIQVVVSSFIESDYKNLADLELAQALQNFVDNWSTLPEEADSELLSMMKNFNAVQQQSLPGNVTRKLYSEKNEELKKTFEETYQRIVLLEIIYNIEELHAKHKPDEANDVKWQAIQQWAQTKKVSLTPTPPSWFAYWPHKIKSLIVGPFFENAFLWTTQTLPYVTKLFFKNLVNSARRFPNPGKTKLDNLANLALSAFQSSTILLAIVWSINVQIRQIIGQITSLPFVLLKSLFKDYLIVTLLLNQLERLKDFLLFFTALYYTAPFLFAAGYYGFAAGLVATIAIGPIVLLSQFIANKFFNQELKLTEDASPWMGGKDACVLGISTFFTNYTPDFIHYLVDTGSGLVDDFKRMEVQIEELQKLPAVTPASSQEDRELHFGISMGLYDDAAKIIRRNTGYHFLQTHRAEIERAMREYYNLDAANNTQNNQAPNSANDPEAVPYDKDNLIGQMMRMKCQMAKTKEQNPEVAEILQQEDAKNPHTYLAQFKSMRDLPEALKKLAKPAANTSAVPQKQNEDNDEEGPGVPGFGI